MAERVPVEESEVTSDNEANSGSEFSLEEEEPNFQWSPSVFADFCRELHLSKIMSQKCLKMLKTHSCTKSSLKDVTTRVAQNRRIVSQDDVFPFFTLTHWFQSVKYDESQAAILSSFGEILFNTLF